MRIIDQTGTSTGSSGAVFTVEILGSRWPTQSALYCSGSTLASTQSFAIHTASHSSGPWVVEGSTSLAATGSVSAAAVLRLTGPYSFLRAYLNSASTGAYTLRLIGTD